MVLECVRNGANSSRFPCQDGIKATGFRCLPAMFSGKCKSTSTIRIRAASFLGSNRSYHHRACGYLAGLHSYRPTSGEDKQEVDPSEESFESFEVAWEALQSVPKDLLNDFEEELWEKQSKRFVYGTKQVSVMDSVEKSSPSKVFRYLILNERPNRIQTAIEVSGVGAPYDHYTVESNSKGNKLLRPRSPSPISQTHLGGLAMALPFWYRANGITNPKNNLHDPPNCLLIGAGGCSLAHTLAANLFLQRYNAMDEPRKQQQSMPKLTVIEACSEIMDAAKLWFGAKSSRQEERDTTKRDKISESNCMEPPFFDLVHDTGELYLSSLVESLRANANNDSDSIPSPRPIDILIIDAEDGSAPPLSMQTPEFWKSTVLPSLNPCSNTIVGVNAIGSPTETSSLVRVMSEAFGGDDSYTMLVVDPPPEAEVTNRHKLIFALPSHSTVKEKLSSAAPYWRLTEDDLNDLVDAPTLWKEQLERLI